LWADYCLNFAGVSITFVNKNRALALYEPNGCIFLSTKEDKVDDLFATTLDTYLTHGKALTLTPYSFLTYCLHTIGKPREEDVYALFAKSSYKNVVVQYTPNKKEEDTIPLYIRMAWEKQMAIQIIQTHYTAPILDWKNIKATYGSHVYYYQSEVIRPKYFNTLEEFACYVATF
jgi:hypothetical protein